jgi:hypothetical protein
MRLVVGLVQAAERQRPGRKISAGLDYVASSQDGVLLVQFLESIRDDVTIELSPGTRQRRIAADKQ